MQKKVLIVGGGIIGICSAYYLSKDGHDVTIIDRFGMDSGASYINAGYLSPGHIIPLASPGVIKQGLKWLLDPESPFSIEFKPSKYFEANGNQISFEVSTVHELMN